MDVGMPTTISSAPDSEANLNDGIDVRRMAPSPQCLYRRGQQPERVALCQPDPLVPQIYADVDAADRGHASGAPALARKRFTDQALDLRKGVVQLARQLAAGLGHVRPASSATLHDSGRPLCDSRGIDAPVHEVRGDHGHQLRPVLDHRAEDDYPAAQLAPQPVADLPQPVHVRGACPRCYDRHSINVDAGVQQALGRLKGAAALGRLGLAAQPLVFLH